MQLIHKAVVFPVIKIGTSTLRFETCCLNKAEKNNIFNTAAVFVYFTHAYYHTVSSRFYMYTHEYARIQCIYFTSNGKKEYNHFQTAQTQKT